MENRFLEQSTIAQINAMVATAPNPPALKLVSDHFEILKCPVCWNIKPGQMLAHYKCQRLICADDALKMSARDKIEERVCPVCRGLAKDQNPLAPTKFNPPSPLITQVVDDILCQCDSCESKFNYYEANIHHLDCRNKRLAHDPPEHVPKRGSGPLVPNEVISNPELDQYLIPTGKSRLIISHLNGRQTCTKIYRKNKTAETVINDIANKSGISSNQITALIYPSIHPPINQDQGSRRPGRS